MLDRLGVIQLDSVNVLARSHDLVPFSRLGPCSVDSPAEQIYRRKRGFEYWGHEASWLPIDLYRHFGFRRAWFRERARARVPDWRCTFRPQHQELHDRIHARIREEGPLSSAAFADDRPGRGTWWDWTPAKRALEDLFACGELTAGGRTRGFARLYDLPERYLPADLDRADPGEHASLRHLLRRAIGALGIATALDAADYYRVNPHQWRPALDDLVASGEVVPVAVEGWTAPAYALPARLDGPLIRPRHRPTFLSPFDNLIFFRPRAERLFGFHYRISIYTPAAQRIHGYYVLPLLARGELVGRADLKLDRKQRLLRCPALFLECARPGALAEHARAVADALRSLATHLGADAIVVERSEPPHLAPVVAAALGG